MYDREDNTRKLIAALVLAVLALGGLILASCSEASPPVPPATVQQPGPVPPPWPSPRRVEPTGDDVSRLDFVVNIVNNRSTEALRLKDVPRSIEEAAAAFTGATGKRVSAFLEYRGVWILSMAHDPENAGPFRFHSGYALKPETRDVYAFDFW